jgi:hypothetical protein
MLEQEKLATYYFWREVGRRMNIKEIPESYEAFEAYNVRYEREYFASTEQSRRVAAATREMFLDWFLPRPLHALGRPMIHALLDDPLLEAFGFPRPPRALRAALQGALKLRARVLRHMPERTRPRMRSEMRHRTYPHGYRIDQLGPPVTPVTDPVP